MTCGAPIVISSSCQSGTCCSLTARSPAARPNFAVATTAPLAARRRTVSTVQPTSGTTCPAASRCEAPSDIGTGGRTASSVTWASATAS